MVITNIEMEMIFTIIFLLERLVHFLANRLSTEIILIEGLVCKTYYAVFPRIKLVLIKKIISVITVMTLMTTRVEIVFSCWDIKLMFNFFA